jgi:Dyp-type peroxidase family
VIRRELEDIQGFVVSGYLKRPAASYGAFSITNVERARAWLRSVVERLQYGEFLTSPVEEEPHLAAVCRNVAFTHDGLKALGLGVHTLNGFHTSFREGMHAPHRARQLGDDGPSAPEKWRWGGPNNPAVHGLLCVFAGNEDNNDEPDVTEREVHLELCEEHGVRLVQLLPAHRAKKRELRKEHFGFRDGISNPEVEGLARSKKQTNDVVPAGELLLGYPNAYQRLPSTPRVRAEEDPYGFLVPEARNPELRDFGRDGSYLVFRQLSQDVAGFWNFVERAAHELPERPDPVWLAARMVGRWPDGSPVTTYPDRDSPAEVVDSNEFRFADNDDLYGQHCPIGSHVRRCNPRDTKLPMPHDPLLAGGVGDEGAEERVERSNRHRIIRRGRLYGTPLDPELRPSHMHNDDGQERGLYFICFNSNPRRQFEFVQGSWMINPCFAGLNDGPDPILGPARVERFGAKNFTLQGSEKRPTRIISDLPRTVEMRGGAYFFMPSRRALHYLANLTERVESLDEQGKHDALKLASLHVQKVRSDFEQQKKPKLARRGFHGKSHGVVRAWIDIDAQLPEAFHTSVFVPNRRYKGWVRFSNGSFNVQSDSVPDVHGCALKLLGVSGARAADFEQTSQDFLLIDSPFLMVSDLAQALAFDLAQTQGTFALLKHLASTPSQIVALKRMLSTPRDLLSRTYSTIVPISHGPGRAVRYVVRPVQSTAGEYTERTESLRAALAARLAAGEVTLELCLQTRGVKDRLDDARLAWSTRPERIATITLLSEGLGGVQETAGEALSFNPWNAVVDHAPRGALNLARRVVYRAVYQERMRLNGWVMREPEPW